MKRYASALDLGALLQEVTPLQFTQDAAGVGMVQPQWREPGKNQTGAVRAALGEISTILGKPVRYLMVNRLAAHAGTPIHTDQGEDVERWHLPVITNPKATWWDAENGEIHMEAGFWWGPVPFTTQHSVQNRGDSERVHIIVDL